MKYSGRRFSVAVSDGGDRGAMCREKGHSSADSRGRCLCCGEKIELDAGPGPHGRLDFDGLGKPSSPAVTDGTRTARLHTVLWNYLGTTDPDKVEVMLSDMLAAIRDPEAPTGDDDTETWNLGIHEIVMNHLREAETPG